MNRTFALLFLLATILAVYVFDRTSGQFAHILLVAAAIAGLSGTIILLWRAGQEGAPTTLAPTEYSVALTPAELQAATRRNHGQTEQTQPLHHLRPSDS